MSVKTETPGIAQTECEDFRAVALTVASKRIVFRDAVCSYAGRLVDVYPQYFTQQACEVLCVVLRVAARTAVARGDIQVSIRAESQMTAVVIGIRLLKGQQNNAAVRISCSDVPGLPRIAGDDSAVSIGVVNVEITVMGIIGVKGQSEQALFLAVMIDQITDIKKHLGTDRIGTVRKDLDSAGSFHDKDIAAAIA